MSEPTPYSDPQWKIVRPRVLARDDHTCQLRLPKCKGQAVAIDHIIDWRDGGPWFDEANLRSACTSCNTAQRNSRVAARARAHRGGASPDYGDDTIVISDITWMSPEDIAKYGPPPAPGQPPRRMQRR